MKKLIDRLDGKQIGAPGYLQAHLLVYGIDPMGLNRHFLIDAVAKVIVAEMNNTPNKDRILSRLRDENKMHSGIGAAPTLERF